MLLRTGWMTWLFVILAIGIWPFFGAFLAFFFGFFTYEMMFFGAFF
jgi:hypothetical protein